MSISTNTEVLRKEMMVLIEKFYQRINHLRELRSQSIDKHSYESEMILFRIYELMYERKAIKINYGQHFYSEDSLNQIKSEYKNIQKMYLRKKEMIEQEFSVNLNSKIYYINSDSIQSPEFDEFEDKYSKYGGPLDSSGWPLDDDFIDDALDGFPEAYWNID